MGASEFQFASTAEHPTVCTVAKVAHNAAGVLLAGSRQDDSVS